MKTPQAGEFDDSLFRHLAENSRDLISLVDLEGRITYESPSITKMLGHGPDDLLGEIFFTLIHEDDRERIMKIFLEALLHKTKEGVFMTYRFRHKDGTYRILETSGNWIFDKDGNPTHGVAISRDVTEHRRMNDRLLLLGTALEASATAVVITDREGLVVWANSAFSRHSGYALEDILHKNPRFQKSGKHDKAFYANLWSTVLSGQVWRGEVVNRRKDGSLHDEEMTITPVKDESGKITHFVAVKQDISERKRVQEEQQRLVAILDATSDMVCIVDPDGTPIYMNQAGRRMVGLGEHETLADKKMQNYHPAQSLKTILEIALPASASKGFWNGELILLGPKGEEIPVSMALISHKDATGSVHHCSSIIRDLRDHRRMEERLMQSQKLEAVGQLAGGIAHDFNNVLTAIIGAESLVQESLSAEDPRRQDLNVIKESAERAAGLTRQLLAFSRKQILKPQWINLNHAVTNIEKILKRLIREDITLKMKLQKEPAGINADPTQIEQVLINLVVNASDAMPTGGLITIGTETVRIENGQPPERKAMNPGNYVLLTVADTGTGMDEATQARIFEPFFTTKPQGKGTGMGLATVYGIVKQSGGYIWVNSKLGAGATFKVYLPLQAGESLKTEPQAAKPKSNGGKETILIAEDEPEVRKLVSKVLKRKGYEVFEASNGIEALSEYEKHKDKIQLLVTDTIMPQMNGKELAQEIAKRDPNLKVLYMSGYTDSIILEHGVISSELNFIQKPFTPDALSEKIRKTLDKE